MKGKNLVRCKNVYFPESSIGDLTDWFKIHHFWCYFNFTAKKIDAKGTVEGIEHRPCESINNDYVLRYSNYTDGVFTFVQKTHFSATGQSEVLFQRNDISEALKRLKKRVARRDKEFDSNRFSLRSYIHPYITGETTPNWLYLLPDGRISTLDNPNLALEAVCYMPDNSHVDEFGPSDWFLFAVNNSLRGSVWDLSFGLILLNSARFVSFTNMEYIAYCKKGLTNI